MWLRRINAGSATHSPPFAGSITGTGVRDAVVLADDCADAGEPPKAKPQASAAKATRRMDAMGGWNAQAMKLVSQAHLDVTRGAYIRTNMAANALVVVGVYVAPSC